MLTESAGPSSASYFAFFSTQKDAAFAAQARIHPEDSHSFRVMEAPGPEEARLCLPDHALHTLIHDCAQMMRTSASIACRAPSGRAVLQLD